MLSAKLYILQNTGQLFSQHPTSILCILAQVKSNQNSGMEDCGTSVKGDFKEAPVSKRLMTNWLMTCAFLNDEHGSPTKSQGRPHGA